MVCSEKHKKLDENGVGLCSVPMWANGVPAGFCEKPAYGPQEKDQTRYGNWIRGEFLPSYCGYLACFHHGGPAGPPKEEGG